MTQRFFKLLYIFSLIAIVLSLPVYLLLEMRFDRIVITTYKAKCLSNNQYVVLQGSPRSDFAYKFDEVILNDTTFSDTKRTLNFYCKHYDEIQPHITAYVKSKTPAEQKNANINFFNFQESVISNVYAYPPLYELEIVKKEFQPFQIYDPIISWLLRAIIAFILLQVVKMSYMYVVFGKIIWHPFRQSSRSIGSKERLKMDK